MDEKRWKFRTQSGLTDLMTANEVDDLFFEGVINEKSLTYDDHTGKWTALEVSELNARYEGAGLFYLVSGDHRSPPLSREDAKTRLESDPVYDGAEIVPYGLINKSISPIDSINLDQNVKPAWGGYNYRALLSFSFHLFLASVLISGSFYILETFISVRIFSVNSYAVVTNIITPLLVVVSMIIVGGKRYFFRDSPKWVLDPDTNVFTIIFGWVGAMSLLIILQA